MSYADINSKMEKFVPEMRGCDAIYKYPMTEKMWCNEVDTSKGPNGEPSSLAGPDTGVKRNYVYGAGPLGKRYYLLLTRNAYKIIYARLGHEMPASCACTKAGRKEYSDWDDVKLVMYNRSVGSRPDDAQCKKDAIDIARGTAIAYYHYDQNYQLVVGAATTAAVLAAS